MLVFDSSEELLAFLEERLHNASTAERRTVVAQWLPRLRGDGVKDVLLDLLEDPDVVVRVTAALALAQRGDPRAIPALRTAFNDSDRLRREEMVRAAEQVRHEDSARLLVMALHDHEAEVRAEAARMIVEMLRHRPDWSVARVFDEALPSLFEPALREVNSTTRQALWAMLQYVNLTATKRFVQTALLQEQEETRLAAVRVLAFFDKGPATAWATARIQEALNDAALAVRLAAVKGLRGRLADPNAVEALDALCSHEPDIEVRNAAYLALGLEPPRPWWTRPLFKTTLATLVLLVLGYMVSLLVRPFYRPKVTFPAPVASLPSENIYGSNVAIEIITGHVMESVYEAPAAIPDLALVPKTAFRLPCPRIMGDVLLARLWCDVLVFGAETPDGTLSTRFLAFRDRGEVKVVALGLPGWDITSPDGTFIELSEDDNIAARLKTQALDILDTATPSAWRSYPAAQKNVYLPCMAETRHHTDIEALRSSNPVVQHLLSTTSKLNPDLSLGGRVFTVRDTGARGIYQPGFKIIQRPMFLDMDLDTTLAHELVHANLDGLENKEMVLVEILPYLRAAHPQMFDVTLPIFYEEELKQAGVNGDLLEVEEMLAFFTGSLSAQETQVYFLVRLSPIVRNINDVVFYNEPILTEDVALLARLDLIPDWMAPDALDYHEAEITSDYYKKVNQRQ